MSMKHKLNPTLNDKLLAFLSPVPHHHPGRVVWVFLLFFFFKWNIVCLFKLLFFTPLTRQGKYKTKSFAFFFFFNSGGEKKRQGLICSLHISKLSQNLRQLDHTQTFFPLWTHLPAYYLVCFSTPEPLRNWVLELNWTKQLHHSPIKICDVWTI